MSVLQSKENEVRFIKRQNLEEEARIYQNYFRDIIHTYGIDCNYYKIKIPYPKYFKTNVDNNTVLLHAYGYDSNPDYQISSHMLTYMEVDSDIFNLNKYGMNPNPDVTFTFDRNEFAAKLAYKLGQYKEFKIKETEVNIEIPTIQDQVMNYIGEDGNEYTYHLSDDIFEYSKRIGIPAYFESDIISGKASFTIGNYELDKEYDVPVNHYIHNNGGYRIPVNKDIYKSFYYNVDVKEYLDVFLYMRYKVVQITSDIDRLGRKNIKNVLRGTLYGTVLFHDINSIGKYIELIQPDVGDIVTIDFPDERSREQYEITECLDKNLASDGLNPLLHKYIWKCKARRYINSGEDFPEKNEANERWKETIDLIEQSDEEIVKKISDYNEDRNDAAYGGYENPPEEVDKQKVDNTKVEDIDLIYSDDGTTITIHMFGNGTKLITDGYELYFIDTEGRQKQITMAETEDHPNFNWSQSGIEYLASTDNAVWFKNFNNRPCKICEDKEATHEEKEMCLNSLIDTTYSTGNINQNGDNFYKFKESKTILLSIDNHLFCRFGNKEKKIVRIV